MAHLGGGAEAHARFKQYEYRANSSLVLTTDTRPRDADEPIGEPESLWGKIDPRSFGDLAYRGRPPELDEKLQKAKRKKKERDSLSELAPRQAKRRRLREASVLTSTEDGVYQPKTKDTRAAYEAMLSVIQQQLGGQPLNIVSGAADEILAVLKNDTFKNPDKKKEIEKLLNSIPNPVFDLLVAIGRLITDHQDASDAAGSAVANGDEALDDDVGVALEFEENEDDDEESDLDMVQEDEEEDEDVAEPNGSSAMQMGAGIDDDDMQEGSEGMRLNVHEIDAYWLQREISQAYERQIESQQCQNLAEEVLKILAEGDAREVETKLLLHLQIDRRSPITFLLWNRLKIVWCTRLARAEDQADRKKIEEEMVGLGPQLAAIVKQLHAPRATAKERQKNLEKSIREEARRLKDESAGDEDTGRRGVVDRDAEGSWLKGQRQLLDLDSLAFEQGGLLMANKRTDLPVGSFKHLSKGYEEVHVPVLKAKPDPNEKLVKISALPDWAQPAFKGMQQLNRVQSKVYETALFSAENILLCAPTGAGKTNVAVLTILQQIALNRNPDGSFNHSN